MQLIDEIIQADLPVSVLRVIGRVDSSNYLRLIEKAQALLENGSAGLFLNLSECDYLSSAGLFALHNIALIANRLEPLNQDEGWGALRKMANEQRELKQRFKIIEVPQNIMNTLAMTGLASLYDVYPDAKSALAALPAIK